MKLLLVLFFVLGFFDTAGCMNRDSDGDLCNLNALADQVAALITDDEEPETEEPVLENHAGVEEKHQEDSNNKATQTDPIDIHNPTLFFASPQKIHFIVWFCLRDVRAQRDLARYLHEKRPVNLLDGKGSTPLHVAAWMGDAWGVDWLLRAGADASIRNHECLTAKEMAELRGHNHVVAVFERYE